MSHLIFVCVRNNWYVKSLLSMHCTWTSVYIFVSQNSLFQIKNVTFKKTAVFLTFVWLPFWDYGSYTRAVLKTLYKTSLNILNVQDKIMFQRLVVLPANASPNVGFYSKVPSVLNYSSMQYTLFKRRISNHTQLFKFPQISFSRVSTPQRGVFR